MKRATTFVFFLVLMVSVSGAIEKTFDQKVSEARRHMRAACQAVQKIEKVSSGEYTAMRKHAFAEAVEADKAWTVLAKEFASSVPDGYAGDPSWGQRLEDVRISIERMREDIENNKWRSAFLSCAHACNLITTMHEANGVTLAIDAMSVLRKKIGFARGLLASGNASNVGPLIKEIMSARNTVVLTPPPSTSNRDAYLKALPELSSSIDILGEAVRRGSEIKTVLDGLAVIVERVYELAI